MNLDQLARCAYEAYSQYLGTSKTRGYKDWDRLPPQRQAAWRAVAMAIMDTAIGAMP